MAVSVFIRVDHHARGRAACGVGVAPRLRAGGIGRNEGLDGFLNRIGAAESAHQPALGRRVSLMLRPALRDVRHAAAGRPAGHVAPVGIGGQDFVGIQQRRVEEFKHEFPVLAGARPIHHARGRIGAVVELVDAQRRGHLAADGRVFLRRYVPVQRHHQAQALLCGRVLVGGIERGCAAEKLHPVRPDAAVGKVRIQAEDRAGGNGGAAAVFAIAAHEAAHVLDFALSVPPHGFVFRRGLRRARRPAQPVQQLRPACGLVFPDLNLAAAAIGHLQQTIELYLHAASP